MSDEDAFIMSLAENIARKGHRPLEILADIELLLARGLVAEDIIQNTGLSQKYVRDIIFLLNKGEERLIEAVQHGTIPLTAALEIARAKDGDENSDKNLGDMLEEAYQRVSEAMVGVIFQYLSLFASFASTTEIVSLVAFI